MLYGQLDTTPIILGKSQYKTPAELEAESKEATSDKSAEESSQTTEGDL